MLNIDKSLANTRDSHESLFTILIYDVSKEEFLNDLKKRLDKIKSITNTFKRKKLNDRLFKLVTHVELSQTEIYNKIILLSDNIMEYELGKTEIDMLKEYSIPNYTFEYGEYFNINWLKDLFENFTFYNVIIFNQNQYTIWNGNLNKKKKLSQTSSQDVIKTFDKPFYFFGKINGLTKEKISNKNLIEYVPQTFTWNECMEHIQKLKIKENNFILQEIISGIKKDSSKYIFGKEIYESIENYNIKELYLHLKNLSEFEKIIKEKNLSDNINFNIIHIDTFESSSSDPSVILLKDFGGMIGIKYY